MLELSAELSAPSKSRTPCPGSGDYGDVFPAFQGQKASLFFSEHRVEYMHACTIVPTLVMKVSITTTGGVEYGGYDLPRGM